jgi:hypothetical protein
MNYTEKDAAGGTLLKKTGKIPENLLMEFHTCWQVIA